MIRKKSLIATAFVGAAMLTMTTPAMANGGWFGGSSGGWFGGSSSGGWSGGSSGGSSSGGWSGGSSGGSSSGGWSSTSGGSSSGGTTSSTSGGSSGSTAVPEPGMLGMMGLGLIGLAYARKRRMPRKD